MPIHIDFFQHGETHAVIDLAILRDGLIAAWILIAKLIAGKAQHRQALVFVGLMNFFESCKLRCEAASAGGVHNQHDLAAKLAQCQALAIHLSGFKIVDRFHTMHL